MSKGTVYYTPGEISRTLRAELRERFPGLRFRQRLDSYSMGASINVHVHPDQADRLEAVREVARRYQWGGFDGTIDLGYSLSAWVDERGRPVAFARSAGTVGSRGIHPAIDDPAPAEGLVEARGGVDYVFVDADPWHWREGAK